MQAIIGLLFVSAIAIVYFLLTNKRRRWGENR